ncbi:MAG: type II toxin-antitoxin system RelE family toxin [Cyanobacteriota bacterium]
MVEYSLAIKPSAAKKLKAVAGAGTLARLIERIKSLDSLPRPSGSEKLAARTDLYRIRHGSYRIIYSVDDQSHVVDVVQGGHRRDVCR